VTTSAPFEYLAHLLTVPVQVAGVDARFVFDTGIGVSLISAALAARVGCIPDGSAFTGRRMSGAAVTVPLGRLASLRVGGHLWRDAPVGVFDMQAMAGLEGVDGFLSLTCFEDTAVTVDYRAGLLIVEEEASLASRAAAGMPVPVQVKKDGCSVDLSLGVSLPSGREIQVEVDTGSDVLILDIGLARDAGIDLNGAGVRKVEGVDETGNEFIRYFATMTGDLGISEAPQLTVSRPQVMFQKIIYDGLVGNQFLRNFTTTYDLTNSRMILETAAAQRSH
jgi:hypothetical protein